jgi:hypothetical protein
MRWVIAFFLALAAIPAAQVAADAWHGRSGPDLLLLSRHHHGGAPYLAVTRHRHLRSLDFIGPYAPKAPGREKTG